MGKQRKQRKRRKSKPRKVGPTGRPGRPLELTLEKIKVASSLYRRGNYDEYVAPLIGVTTTTLKVWMKKGAKAREAAADGATLKGNDVLYALFAAEVIKAKAGGIVSYNDRIDEIAMQDDSPSAALAATKFRLSVMDDRYSERRRTELTGADGGAVKLEVGGSMADAINNALAEVPGLVLDGDDDDDA